eukprot:6029932-Amphidinium_carterae.1
MHSQVLQCYIALVCVSDLASDAFRPFGDFLMNFQVMPIEMASFIAHELAGIATDACRHRYGCRILCRHGQTLKDEISKRPFPNAQSLDFTFTYQNAGQMGKVNQS